MLMALTYVEGCAQNPPVLIVARAPSEDSIINIVGGKYATVNTKALFAFSAGFVPKSIRKICTLHRYEFENLALSKLSRCFSPIQQISKKKNVKLKVTIFTPAFCDFIMYHLHVLFFLILCPSKITGVQEAMIWM